MPSTRDEPSWDLGADSPLLAHLDGAQRRARFSVRPVPPRDAEPVGRLLAGAAEVDITPPPGLPKAGYSANAHDGTGFRTRLRARVLHLRSDTGSLALVQCDLLGGSAVVAHLVARHIAERTDVPLAGLLIGATHTHAGPGQFLGTDFYNRFASNRGGFDPAWTQWLATRIAHGVVRAVEQRRPAKLALGSTEVWGLTRNRSLDPHVRNAEVEDRRTDPQRKWVSVNPCLHLLRVDSDEPGGPGRPLGAMMIFSVHGTGVPMRASEYNADLWAYAVGELSQRVERAHGVRAVVGAVEGTHADVAPALRPGMAGHLEAQRVGRQIGVAAAELHERLGADLSPDVALGAGLREVDLDADRCIGDVCLPRRPAVGAALVAGAHENTTPVLHRLPPFRAGSPKPWRTRHPQGAKWVIGTRWLQPLVLPQGGFPRVLPVQVLRIGDAALVGLPFEVTVGSGRRIEAAVRDAAAGSGVERVIVSSVANEYSGYVATAEEYERQHYEGGHTLYGPATQPFLAAHAARLAGEALSAPDSVVSDVLDERRFDLRVHRYLPSDDRSGVEVARRMDGGATFEDPTTRRDAVWIQHWVDVAPGSLAWHEPLVRVEASDDGGPWQPARSREGRVVDDQGWDLEITHLGPQSAEGAAGPHRYRVRWHDPSFRAGRRHRFVLEANAGRPEVAGEPFD